MYARVQTIRVASAPPLAGMMRDVIYFGVTRCRYQSFELHLLRASVTETAQNRHRHCYSDDNSEALNTRAEGSATCDRLK